jgi:hypothetical protein
MKEFFKQIFTDAKGRPEIKNVIGIPATIAGLIVGGLMICGIVAQAWSGWLTYMGFAVGLLVTTAAADAAIDKAEK